MTSQLWVSPHLSLSYPSQPPRLVLLLGPEGTAAGRGGPPPLRLLSRAAGPREGRAEALPLPIATARRVTPLRTWWAPKQPLGRANSHPPQQTGAEGREASQGPEIRRGKERRNCLKNKGNERGQM